MAVEPYFSEFIEKLKPDLERLRVSNDFGVKIYSRLVKQYPQLSSDSLYRGIKPGHFQQKKAKPGKKAQGKKKEKKAYPDEPMYSEQPQP